MRVFILFLACLVPLISGCAQDPIPKVQMALTQKTLEQAQSVGASSAQAEFSLATEKLARAEKNMREADYKRARLLAEQAELDARLSEAKTLSERAEQQLQALDQRILVLRHKLQEVQ